MSILDLISLPESKTLEFKEKMPESLAIAKTAYTREEKIANIVYTMVEPTVAFHVSIHNLEGKLILKIDVFP